MASKRHFQCLLAGSVLLAIALAVAGTRELMVTRRASPRVEEIRQKLPRSSIPHAQPFKYTIWEPARYVDDARPFLVKLKEIASEIEVFPFQWLAYPGAYGGYLHINDRVDHRDAQRSFHFADLARQATGDDLKDCAAYLPRALPNEKVLLMVVLHVSLDDSYLPVIAECMGDYAIPFPLPPNEDAKARARQRHGCVWWERMALGKEVRWKSHCNLRLNYFEQRVLRDIRRFDPLYSSGIGPEYDPQVDWVEYVSDYARAILWLRGCGLVETMREMSRFNGPMLPGSYMDGYEDPPTPVTVFTDKAWEDFHSMPFHVRRLRNEYIAQVECVAPPYQAEAVARFVKKLRETPPRTAALAFFSISPNPGDGPRMSHLLISNWPEYVRRIPKEQIEELLTSANLTAIDADLAFEQTAGSHIGYHPYYNGFFPYVLQHRSEWFDDTEFAAIEPRLSSPAQRSWTTVERIEARKRR